MQFSTALLAAVAAVSAYAATDAHPFTSTAVAEEPFAGLPITARGNYFYLGGSPETFCPDTDPKCPPGKVTAFSFFHDQVFLDCDLDQQVYVYPNGVVGFTPAHGANPSGVTTKPFVRGTSNTTGHPVDNWHFKKAEFFACHLPKNYPKPHPPNYGGRYVLLSIYPGDEIPAGCLPFSAKITNYDHHGPAAFQYD